MSGLAVKAKILEVAKHRKPGAVQTRIYVWLLQEEESLRAGNDTRVLEKFEKLGVLWRPTALFSDDSSEIPDNPSVSASTALANLREKEMVEKKSNTDLEKRHRTSHVKLTHQGYVRAFQAGLSAKKSFRVPKLTLAAVKQDINDAIRLNEDLDKSIGRLLEVSGSVDGRLSLLFNDEPAGLLTNELRQIALLADQLRKQRLEELKSYLEQLDRIEH